MRAAFELPIFYRWGKKSVLKAKVMGLGQFKLPFATCDTEYNQTEMHDKDPTFFDLQARVKAVHIF